MLTHRNAVEVGLDDWLIERMPGCMNRKRGKMRRRENEKRI
jgi:hypothetical protein